MLHQKRCMLLIIVSIVTVFTVYRFRFVPSIGFGFCRLQVSGFYRLKVSVFTIYRFRFLPSICFGFYHL